ncbi:hypothetical protein HMPREF0044_1531 [Gleimia coleocanis DSM 15436]|uniref:Uncharacterized protein n=1 Tax=Gleimia coleocanis DSM 15436 TaxID=525245 RepID=C0W278_9ACTO|nr:hypothetical protein [Gleimia coleocanis]EEH63292.1 hypothetical protein HMPREF0044_1531 [Gleimia coleocanis DSM 15436]
MDSLAPRTSGLIANVSNELSDIILTLAGLEWLWQGAAGTVTDQLRSETQQYLQTCAGNATATYLQVREWEWKETEAVVAALGGSL